MIYRFWTCSGCHLDLADSLRGSDFWRIGIEYHATICGEEKPLKEDLREVREADLSIAGWLLLPQAKTLRERAFCRLIETIHANQIEFVHDLGHRFNIYPVTANLEGMMKGAYDNMLIKAALQTIPISQPPRSALADAELIPALQDLADIVAWEATCAFASEYYPGIPDIVVPEEHIETVMVALQREMDREGKSRRRPPIVFTALPKERQRALAERRRFWFARFGITPESWQTGQWSVWRVTEDSMPDMQAEMAALAESRSGQPFYAPFMDDEGY